MPGDGPAIANCVGQGIRSKVIFRWCISQVWDRARKRAVRRESGEGEDQRVAVTRALGLFETPPEERFDRITRIAAALFDVPIALIALMDRDREWFKSSWGLELRELPRDESLCGHAIYSRGPLVVPDATLDERFADNPHVTGFPGVRFYAGQPLILESRSCVGTLSILDTRPRHLDNSGIDRLRDLADLAVREIEMARP